MATTYWPTRLWWTDANGGVAQNPLKTLCALFQLVCFFYCAVAAAQCSLSLAFLVPLTSAGGEFFAMCNVMFGEFEYYSKGFKSI